MSNTEGTCEYVLDPDDPETWGGDEGDNCTVRDKALNNSGNWSCPHSAENHSFCIFHREVDEKNNEEAVDRLVELIENRDDGNIEVLNAKFGDLDLSRLEKVGSDSLIDMTQATILGKIKLNEVHVNSELLFTEVKCSNGINLSESTFSSPVDFTGSHIKNSCELYRSTFNDVLQFRTATIMGKMKCERANFNHGAGFGAEFYQTVSFGTQAMPEEAASFNGPASFSGAVFYDNLSFAGVNFHDEADFSHIKVKNEGEAYFARVDFSEYASFWDSEFSGEVDFTGTEFKYNADFREIEVNSECTFQVNTFHDNAYFQKSRFSEKVTFFRVDFTKDANFSNAEIAPGSDFNRCKFHDIGIFRDCNLINCDFSNSDLSGARLDNIKLSESNFESAILSRVTLFGTDLRGARLSGAVLGDVRINEDTKLLGHPSDDSDTSPYTFSAIWSQPTCVYDPDYEEDNEHEERDKAKSVYRALEELGRKHARPRLQARSFVRRQDLQKQDYLNDATAGDATLQEQLIAGARWSRAKAARATLLYGESPWRVITWSLGIIFSFAVLYPLGGWVESSGGNPITYGNLPESIYFSTLTYTALGFGDFQPVGLGRLLTTLETGLGAIMLALLVFILGRRAAR